MRRAGCCSAEIALAAQPSSTFGSPDDLVTRGVRATAPITAAFITDIANAVDGKRTAKAIRSALRRAAREFDDKRFATAAIREIQFGLMLGALDSHFEMEEGVPVGVETFTELHEYVRRLADVDPRFVDHPMAEALADFSSREIVTPELFKRMKVSAKRRSFSIAGAASEEMIATAHAELTRVIGAGADLRDFRDFVKDRLEGAGWTPQNASHVETIFRTNVQSAYNAGRYQQMSQPDVVAERPYWQVLTPNDGPPRQRPNHQAAHLRTFNADDPAFPEAFTPWDYNCRCRMRSLSRRQLGERDITPGSWLAANELPAAGFAGGARRLTA
jgi:SPP1 gp7 family putative phage head morphogenesis protein